MGLTPVAPGEVATIVTSLEMRRRPSPAPLLPPSPLWGWLAGLALGPTVGALLLYTAGLQRVPAGVASITATIEPVVAMALAVTVLGERLEPGQLAGAGLILVAVLLLSAPGRRRRAPTSG